MDFCSFTTDTRQRKMLVYVNERLAKHPSSNTPIRGLLFTIHKQQTSNKKSGLKLGQDLSATLVTSVAVRKPESKNVFVYTKPDN